MVSMCGVNSHRSWISNRNQQPVNTERNRRPVNQVGLKLHGSLHFGMLWAYVIVMDGYLRSCQTILPPLTCSVGFYRYWWMQLRRGAIVS
jgi:hypothetical protein